MANNRFHFASATSWLILTATLGLVVGAQDVSYPLFF